MTNLSRRSLLTRAAAASLVLPAACATTISKPRFVAGRMRHASIGVGGMGSGDTDEIGSHPEVDVVALCDVDSGNLAAKAKQFPEARLYRDWRELLITENGRIDSVSVSTPDHMHAPITTRALELGHHVYCQKPLTRTVREARFVAETARDSGAVTQMGIQNHSRMFYRQALEWFRAGHIGRIHTVHVWTDRPNNWWPQGVDRPPGSDPVPETLDWDLWLGVAPERSYVKGQYHPFSWRGWKDFGTGAQGDMACHLMDPALWFPGLGDPLRIRSDGPAPNSESYPLWSRVHYEFPSNDWTTAGPLWLTWHDGGRKPGSEVRAEYEIDELPANGCLFLGEEGALLADPYDSARLFPAARFEDVELPPMDDVNHWHQWVDACRGLEVPVAGFDTSSHLTEVALLGNVALAFPHETLEWDARHMTFPNRPEADALLGADYREGWSVRGLG